MSESQRMARQAFERRFKAKGCASLTVRLSAEAHATLHALAVDGDCTRREVLERLILSAPVGDVRDAMKAHGLSESEAREYVHG
jgi:N-acetylglutamate synthase-like GNAT family acetyltransferase